MAATKKQQILFSDCFCVEKEIVEDHGAFNISLLSDLPLFIDPFLLFNSIKEEYQLLHQSIIRYLTFLRDKSVKKEVTPGLLDVWYRFTEVKQTWLGFAKGGNQGSGLGPKFARTLDRGFHRLFGDEEETQITGSKHLEKLCLIQEGVYSGWVCQDTDRTIFKLDPSPFCGNFSPRSVEVGSPRGSIT